MADAKTSPYGQWLRVIWVAHIIPVKLSLMYYFGLGVACLPPYRGHMFNKYSVAYQVCSSDPNLSRLVV